LKPNELRTFLPPLRVIGLCGHRGTVSDRKKLK
jgi:hypothetical protein